MIATAKMIGFSGHVEISQDSVPLIGKALRDRLGTMHGPFVGITMMGPGADQVFARSCWSGWASLCGDAYARVHYRDEFEDPGAVNDGRKLTGRVQPVCARSSTSFSDGVM
jgi:hypothetical protein